jgi:hypothetical protein
MRKTPPSVIVAGITAAVNQILRCKQRVFDPRGSRQISMQAWLLGLLLAGIKELLLLERCDILEILTQKNE